MKLSALSYLALAAIALLPAVSHGAEAKKTIVLIAGKQSHGPGEHEHNAGVQLLGKCLSQAVGDKAEIKIHLNAEWPSDEILGKADTVLIYSDGGTDHPALDHLDQLAKEMKRGCGYICLHYAVEVPQDKGGPQFLDWLGGYFEANWSVNPDWQADFKNFPAHPITSGVKPFSTMDEWYFHMRFKPEMAGITPILSDVPPESTMSRKDGPHSGNPTVRAEVAAKKPQHLAWAVERPDGGRGFGFTGGHHHKSWGNDDQRKLVLNAILWSAKMDVPAAGVPSQVTAADLEQNLDPKRRREPRPAVQPAVQPAIQHGAARVP